ncbi:hypothetical protein [Bifidobacterium cebidarum]|uniref:Bacterial type II secretion system protein F domain n=1 Tax=Bifidobacterium cebidarum TaxID=2650773 RepID=A0A6I1GDV4_9BIFI|nr:hypothetical protein [Bifidobacterium cebidarum]KAB7788862.1 Bacterial type II secretion system protein F domain [Bifidobacterium cebidarum]
MSGIGSCAAAISCALAVWLHWRPQVIRNRLPSAQADIAQTGASQAGVARTDDCGLERRNLPDDVLQAMLILRLLHVALAQGSSIPAACAVVGAAAGGGIGMAVARAGNLMQRGVAWSDAWHIAQREQSDRAGQSELTSSINGHRTSTTPAGANMNANTTLVYISVIRSALEPSWRHGDAPGIRLESTVEQLDRDACSAIKRHAAKLSVKLLLPTGLCFLPAFILIGVIPSIASFVM